MHEPLSQAPLPSTEEPGSPVDPGSSFRTEINDDRPPPDMVIPSSLTPPPSSQVDATTASRRSAAFSQPQRTAPVSPPATILNTLRDRQATASYVPPSSDQLHDASADQLREMLQTCSADNQRLKMETAHHKLQFNLLSLQADEDLKRAAVEHEMVRREVEALRVAKLTRQAKREYTSPADGLTSKYLTLRSSYEAVMEENDNLHRRMHTAKKVIQQKEEETMALTEERDMLLNRIRENREHFQMLCSPGGLFHGVLTPHQSSQPLPQPSRHVARTHGSGSQHGLSMILQAMSQGDDNDSAPSTPAQLPRSASQQDHKYSRNAQSISSLPTTPVNRARGQHAGLLPSADLVPQSEPRLTYSEHYFKSMAPDRPRGHESRESTISADEGEDVGASKRGVNGHAYNMVQSRDGQQRDEQDVSGSQASQAATDLLRRHPGHQSFNMASSAGSRDDCPAVTPAKPVSKPRSRLPKRRLGGTSDAEDTSAKPRRRNTGSSAKKARTAGDDGRGNHVGLGIQNQ